MRASLIVIAAAGLFLAGSPSQADPVSPLTEGVGASPVVETAPALSDDRIILRFRAGLDAADRVQAREDAGAQDYGNLGKRFQVITLQKGVDIKDALADLRANPDVLVASRDGYSDLHAAPNDPLYNQLWGLENKGLNIAGVASSTVGDDINAIDAWAKTTGDDSVVIADLDSGYRPMHPDLKDRLWTNPGETPGDGIDNDGNGFVDDLSGMDFVGANMDVPVNDTDPTDDVPSGGHGVHTAGTIAAAGNNGVGITGVAQKARIMPLRVCGWSPSLASVRCPFSSTIAAINYAGANGARVANMSIGGTTFNAAYRDAFAANPNVLFVVSAGNDGKDVEIVNQTTYPCSYDPTTSGVVGALDNIVCVAASDQNDAKASFSNWGKTKVDVAAPGTETLSTYVTSDKLKESFEGAFSFSGWTQGGWKRVNGAPLSSDGITNDTATQTGGTTRTVTTPTVSVTGPGQCMLTFFRKLTSTGNDDQAVNDKFVYQGLVNGTPVVQTTGFNQSPGVYSLGIPVSGVGAQQVSAAFAFRKGSSTSASNGVWLDDVKFSCFVPSGEEDSTSYAFLQGTSMAAPHVTGEAGLLAAYEPTASAMQMKSAILSSVDPVAQFNPTTGSHPISSGGRANADAALTALDQAVAPDTEITSKPAASSTPSVSFAFKTTSRAPATFECKLDSGLFAACTSPRSISALSVGSHTFSVRAKDSYNNLDSTPATFTWDVAAAPTVTAVTPNSGPAAGGTNVTVTGTGFSGTPTVTFGGTACTGVNRASATTLTCTTNARVAGSVTVTVTNPDTQGGSKANAYTYLLPAPTVTAVSPATGPAVGGTNVTVSGTGFTGTPTVSFGGSACTSVNRASATSLTCTTSAHAAGDVTVTVTNPDTQSGSKSAAFAYVTKPTLASVTPSTGPVPGGTMVTLLGTGFMGTPTVTFNGRACDSVNRVDSSTVTCVTPAASGPVVADVVLTNPDGQSDSMAGAFTYLAPEGTPDPGSTPPADGSAGHSDAKSPVASVTRLTAKRVNKGKVAKLKWMRANNAVRYEFACVPKGSKVKAFKSVTRTSAKCTGLKPSKTYVGYVRAVGVDAFSAPMSVKVRRWR